ncbi:karyopherin/importin beta family nuclear export signal receptor Crm1 [Schizosaccharomyces pombe]|uniref:Exportin-1 n=1 Tax=Schizosaccharomyces pombe (strain 972 / ATCC 24843) TaxID=284812 RepID=XPO1_SCHPO|nr:importin family nuclear export receptor Crm1 [Schizosaccharomyces pombe]P14068.3 RecName: Full=Exportin-1; AltName: Full=Caffeine resistance protein 2; AltName: Full=Chromosome region maintenance protein 1 [Schizosaccharomyces pombe 972h-]CAB40824.2 crm1 [Schizosaccharomyces pombe]CAB55858.2 importin family nuclear export receptor Crm1 [Schizosaccharomyces pombe]|eukprot:NP_001342911.1 importin family nuclear export receptor Crm1 [Schizosaccharomyces pombe]
MEGILAFDRELDVALLDRVVQTFYQGVGAEQQQAQQVLTQFQAHPDAWSQAYSILEKSEYPQTKYIALSVLDKLITTRWKMLPKEQRLGIRNYIVAVMIKNSSDETVLQQQKTFLNKLDLTLVQILKQEWPHNWPNFIPEIVQASKTNLSLCENNMIVLRLLSEEIFDYSAEQMTQLKTKNLKNQMCGEFAEIFQLCSQILERAQKPSLIKATLGTLLRFLNWIPLGYIFETNIVELITNRFLNVPDFRNVTIECLTEIASLTSQPQYNDKFVTMFNLVMTSVNSMLPLQTDFREAYEESSTNEQDFIQNLALFLCAFFSSHLRPLENPENQEVLLNAHSYLLNISRINEREIFKICLEYWSKLVAQLYEEMQQIPMSEMNPLLNLSSPTSLISSNPNMLANLPLRKHIYKDILSTLRLVMIENMVKPEEVLIVENDEGEIVREFVKETDTITLYKSMREVLVYLTHLDVVDTEIVMTEKLARIVVGTEWSWQNLNTLCWAIGSISGAMNEEMEKRFLVNVIKDLLGLCEMKRGKDNKAVVASNIMYVVGQYPRFLKAHWKFLKTVVNKLFEFMHEYHEGVQDMACDTFIKIAQKCRRHFVAQQLGETEPFINEIIRNLAKTTEDLTPQQTHTFYEACGYMISAQPQKHLQERLIFDLMALPNQAWENIVAQAAQNAQVLGDPQTVKILANVLKTNVAACTSIGSGFYPQIAKNYVDMLGLYKAVSGLISEVVAAQGNIATKTPHVRGLRTIKKEILKLVDAYISRAEDLELVGNTLIPALFEAVLLDYLQNVPDARDAEVLNLITTIVNQLSELLTDKIPLVLDAVFGCTLEMISKDFSEYPEHRAAFFQLLRAINLNCFPALLNIPAPQFKLVINSIVWSFKHVSRDIQETGLNILLELINNMASMGPDVSNAFFQTYYISLLQDILYVLTDSDHKSGFKLQSLILARLFYLVESNQITVPLYDPSQFPQEMNNQLFLRQYIMNLLVTAFPHLQPIQIQEFVQTVLALNQDSIKFKLALRDFLIQLKEFGGDNAELYLEEKEQELAAQQKAQLEKAMTVPGMIKPVDMPTMEEEEL